MEFTFELAKVFGVLPFEIMKQDKDEVILLINYLIDKSEEEPTKLENNSKKSTQRIKVNDKTATGGWY